MTLATAYWCVLIVALLPYVWTVVAKAGGGRFDNRNPRAWLAKQDDPRRQRANAAQLNGFEAFPAFAASVLMAQLAGVDVARIALLAIIFVACRVLHGVFYVANIHLMRSLVWFGGFICVLTLMGSAALTVASGS